MKRLGLSLLLLVSSLVPIGAFAETHRIDWTLAGLQLGSNPAVTYSVIRLDVDSGDRYFPAAGALYPPSASASPIYPVSGTCIYQPSGLIKCNLMLELGSLVIEVGSTLGGEYKLIGHPGTITHSGMVLYTGISQ